MSEFRPVPKPSKDKRLSVALASSEVREIQECAERNGLNTSEFIRQATLHVVRSEYRTFRLTSVGPRFEPNGITS